MKYLTSGFVGKIYKNNSNIVKMVPIEKDKKRLKRLIKEIETLKLLQKEAWSTNIISVEKRKESVYIRMEKLDKTVCEWSKESHSVKEWIDLYRQLFAILYTLHNKYKINHTDVHCGNLMWKGKRLYLIDYGVVSSNKADKYDYGGMIRLVNNKYLINETNLFYYIKENSDYSDRKIWNIISNPITLKRYVKQHSVPIDKLPHTIIPPKELHPFLNKLNKDFGKRTEDILKQYFPVQYCLTKLSLLEPNLILSDPPTIVESWGETFKNNSIVDHYSFKCRMKCKLGDKSPEEYKEENPDKSWREAQKAVGECTNFNISRVIYLIKYLFPDNYQQISWLDPSAGWGSRLLGAISLQIKKYRATDPNSCLEPIYKKMIEELSNGGDYKVIKSGFESYDIDDKYDLVFTSPPFFDFEVYSNNDEQSIKLHITEEAWTNNFLIPLIKRGKEALKPNGYLVLYIEPKGDISYEHLFTDFTTLYMRYEDQEKGRPFYIWQNKSVVH